MITNQKKKYQSSDVFIFPPNSQGLETVSSVFQLMSILRQKFRKSYRNRPDIRLQYQFTFPNFYSYVQGLQYVKLIAHCKYCSHQLVYFKNQSFQQSFKLVAFRNYHVHTRDPKKIRQVYMKTSKDAPRVYRYQPYYLKILRVKNQKHDPSMTAEEYFKSLPIQIKMVTRMKLVMERYGLTQSEFNALARKINSQYQITLQELFYGYDCNQISYAYAPSNILQQEERHLNRKKNLHYAHPLYPQPQPQNENEVGPQSIQFVDRRNPHIPNILIIVTARMKELYKEFGQYVGFDLTFSIIRERPTQHKQYLVGVFGGSTQSKRIIIYGLIVTNSQTVEAYKFIFSQFFKLMGSCPSAILTDEEKPLYYALKQLRQQKVFTGNHYFDMFHIMKKFRKSADGNCFQLYRKILHVSNKAEYRQLFNQLRKQVNNDKELNLLRTFDNNSQKFCFSQISPQFVGASISNSINQKFHDILKYNLPFESKYIKAVATMLQISSQLNDSKEPDLEMYPLEESMNIPFLKPYRTLFSRSAFKIIMREVGRAGRHILLTESQQRRENLIFQKLEQKCGTQTRSPQNFNKTEYFIHTEIGPYKVYKKYSKQDKIMNQNPLVSSKKGKWHCMCEFQQKSGIVCSHIIKVLLHLGEDFMNNLHKRWLIKPEQITNRIRNFRYVGKFSALRSKHKIRVKGYKGMNRNNLFGNYSKEYEPDMMSTTADGEETEFMSSEIDSKSRYQDSEYTSQQSSNFSLPISYQRQRSFETSSRTHLVKTRSNKFDVQEMDEQKQQQNLFDIQERDQNDEQQDF